MTGIFFCVTMQPEGKINVIMEQIRIEKKDKDFLVVYKPAGIAVQSARVGEMDLQHWLLGRLAQEETGKGAPYLAVIHRLDQPVEGLLVFARNKKTAGILSGELQQRRMVKEYLAVVERTPKEESGCLTDILLRDGRTNCSRVAAPGTPGGKEAALEYRCLQKHESGRALLRIRLLTGRHHQIRVQLAHAGMPIAGDRKYGFRENPGKGGLGLCAETLSFRHPVTGEPLRFRIRPLGEAFRIFDLALDG